MRGDVHDAHGANSLTVDQQLFLAMLKGWSRQYGGIETALGQVDMLVRPLLLVKSTSKPKIKKDGDRILGYKERKIGRAHV